MSRRTNYVLLVVAVALTVYVYFFEAGSNPLTHRGRVFPDLDAADIVDVLVERPALEKDAALGIDSRPLRLRREGSPPAWWIVEPYRFEAFHPRVQSMVEDLADLVRWSEVPAGEAPQAFAKGIQVKLSFTTRSGAAHVVEIGAEHPDPKVPLVYCRVDGAGLVVSRDFWQGVRFDAVDDFRSRALVGIAPQDAGAVEVSGDPRFDKRIVRDGSSERWRLAAPIAAQADREIVEALLRELNAWTIASFHSDAATAADLAACGLSTPRGRVKVERRGGGGVSLDVGGEASATAGQEPGTIYLRFTDQPFVFTAAPGPVALLFTPAEEIRGRYAFDLGAEDIDEISYEGAGVPRTTLRRRRQPNSQDGSWDVLGPAGETLCPGDRKEIEAQAMSLRRLLIHRFLPQPLAALRGKLQLRTQSGTASELHFGEEATAEEFRGENMYFAAMPGEPGSYLVSTILVDAFEQGPDAFRNKSVSSLDAQRVQEVRFLAGVDVWSLARALPEDPWMLSADTPALDNRALNSEVVERVLVAVDRNSFRVKRYAPEVKDLVQAQLELASPRRALIVDRVAGDATVEPRRIVLGIPFDDSGDTLARVDTAGVPPFVVGKEISQLFDALAAHLRWVTGRE